MDTLFLFRPPVRSSHRRNARESRLDAAGTSAKVPRRYHSEHAYPRCHQRDRQDRLLLFGQERASTVSLGHAVLHVELHPSLGECLIGLYPCIWCGIREHNQYREYRTNIVPQKALGDVPHTHHKPTRGLGPGRSALLHHEQVTAPNRSPKLSPYIGRSPSTPGYRAACAHPSFIQGSCSCIRSRSVITIMLLPMMWLAHIWSD